MYDPKTMIPHDSLVSWTFPEPSKLFFIPSV